MRVIDPDGHFFEPIDWLNYADPELAAELPPPRPFADVLMNSIAQGVAAALGSVEDPTELVTIENRQHSIKTGSFQPLHQVTSIEDELQMFDGAARIALCDAEGIDIQFLSPTAGLNQLTMQLKESGRTDLHHHSLVMYNSWAAQQVHGYTDRLMPVTQTDTVDVEWTIAEMTRMRALGSRAFLLPRNRTKSYSHPDFEPLWSAAEDLEMAAYLHIQFGTPVDPMYANNGRGFETYIHLSSRVEAAATRQFLMAMVFDGVFERHPRLRLILAECGHSWFPEFLFDIDAKTNGLAMDGLPQENFYKLPLKPSEYIRRQVRVTLLTGFIASGMEWLSVEDAMERLPGDDLLVFSSDYPHVEGNKSAVPFFEPLLPPDEKVRASFFGDSMAQFMGF